MPTYQASFIGHGVTLLTPSADGAAGEPIITDGAGALSFATGVVLTGGEIALATSKQVKLGDAQDYTVEWDGSDAVHTITAGTFVFTGGTVAVSGRLTASDIVIPTAYIGVIKTRGSTYDLVFQLRNADDEKDFIFKNNAGDVLVTITGDHNVLVNDPSGHEALTVRASTAIAAAAADGGNTGLDDLTSGGTFTGYAVTNYKIEIDGGDPANPNTFKWSDDGGATWDVETVAITGAAQTLNNGVTVTFGAMTGHDTGDFWIFATSVEQPLLLEDESGNALVQVLNNGNIGTPNDVGVFFSGTAGPTDYTWGWDGDNAVHTITAGGFEFVGGGIRITNTDYGGIADGLSFGTGNTGLYEAADNVLYWYIGGQSKWKFAGNNLIGIQADMRIDAGSGTSTTLPRYSFEGDENTGIGTPAADTVNIITGGTERVKVDGTGIEVAGWVRDVSANYRRYYHLPLASLDPGASGAVWTPAGANTPGGWQMDNAGEVLESKVDLHADWDGASDVTVDVRFQINVASAENNTVDFTAIFRYMGLTETATRTQTVTGSTNVGLGGVKAQFTMFQQEIVLPYDTGGQELAAGDCLGIDLYLNTTASDVDNVILNAVTYHYNTTHVGIESGDT